MTRILTHAEQREIRERAAKATPCPCICQGAWPMTRDHTLLPIGETPEGAMEHILVVETWGSLVRRKLNRVLEAARQYLEARGHISERILVEKTLHVICPACARISEWPLTNEIGNLVRCQNCDAQIAISGRYTRRKKPRKGATR